MKLLLVYSWIGLACVVLVEATMCQKRDSSMCSLGACQAIRLPSQYGKVMKGPMEGCVITKESLAQNVTRYAECRQLLDQRGEWADRHFDPDANKVDEDSSDFYTHSLFLTSVKATYVEDATENFYKCMRGETVNSQGAQQGAIEVVKNGTIYCEPGSRRLMCPTGSTCSTKSIAVYSRENPAPSTFKRLKQLSYCVPEEMNEELDEACFEKSYPNVAPIVEKESEKATIEFETVKPSVDRQLLQSAFETQGRCVNERKARLARDVGNREKRGLFGKKFKKWFKRTFKAIVRVVNFVKRVLDFLAPILFPTRRPYGK